MAIFSRIALLACIATSSLLVVAHPPVNSAGQVTARHLRRPQARAYHAHIARVHPTEPQEGNPDTEKEDDTNNAEDTLEKRAGGGKAGLALNDQKPKWLPNLLKTGKVTWCYTWSPWSPGGNCEFVPMLWSDKQLSAWNSQVVKSGKKFKNILAFNEPDQSGQANMSVGKAISLWNAHIKNFPARHGSPAVTSSPKGLKWLDDFVARCKGCKIDFLCVHHYGMNADAFIKMIKDLHNRHPSKPIWVTEWACHNYGSNQERQCSSDEVKKFLAKTQKFLDGASYVERYAWFGALTKFPGGFNTKNRLVSSNGAVTALGQQYIKW